MEKIDVNGDDRHPIYDVLTETADAEGVAATSAGTSRSSWSPPTATSSPASLRRSSPTPPR